MYILTDRRGIESLYLKNKQKPKRPNNNKKKKRNNKPWTLHYGRRGSFLNIGFCRIAICRLRAMLTIHTSAEIMIYTITSHCRIFRKQTEHIHRNTFRVFLDITSSNLKHFNIKQSLFVFITACK